ncbi:hypothetical protein Ahy_A02g007826 [Arachis hypogaea]|uniref:Ubiquitin-like protease family profile domain-containing protein n=1 Tax=Arachis hypogaea TaxID=3818 RepID=A0A445EDA3_ARAHY|nr:hypothetical protein Ahy_A02g007826 [Arachis hypogaea]
MFIPYLDLKKLSSHPYHWWTWMADVRNKKFRVLDPYNKKCPSPARMKLNKFIGYVISRIRVFAGGQPLRKNDYQIEPPYVNIASQRMEYKSRSEKFSSIVPVYVMKWLETIEPENIKKSKYDRENWTQAEVDHFRVEYASQILFDEMNKERDTTIRESEAIRLSMPFAALLSPYCQLDSNDINGD